MISTTSDAAQVAVELPLQFSSQGANGIYYEAYSDNRPSNTLHPGATGASLLTFSGTNSNGNGSVINTGPTFSNLDGGFPYIQFDTARNTLLMHPGSGGGSFGTGSSNLGASVRFVAPQSGVYHINGSFARANNFSFAGDGVDVAIFRGFDAAHPIFSATIGSGNAVNTAAYFSGTGVVNFDVNVALSFTQNLRFVVFSDAQGQDGTFDATAFRVLISVPEPDTFALCAMSMAGFALLLRRRLRHASRIVLPREERY